MATVVKTTFQLKRGTAAKWVELNLVLAAGEPGFEIDSNRLKIGDGKTAWVDLPYIGEGSVVNAATHYDFPETGAAGVIYKAETEKLLYQWNESLKAYEALGGGEGGSIIIDTELSESSTNAIANKAVAQALKELESKITGDSYAFGEGLIVEEVDGIQTVRVDYEAIANLIPEIDLSNLATIEALEAVENKIPAKVSDLENDAGYLTEHQDLSDYALKSDIPSLEGLATETYVQQKIAEAELSGGEVDLSAYYTKEEVDARIPSVEGLATEDYVDNISINKKYEVLPIDGMYVKYGVNEIRLNTQRVVPTHQSVGSTGNPNMYYVTFRAYAPAAARYSIESNGTITDTEPQPLSKDSYGRYYSVIWTSIASYDGSSWSLYGDKSTVDKYLGFNYTFTWYAEDKTTILGEDKVRVILTNDECHNILVEEPTARYIDDKISTIETTLENNYITIENGVTKEELTETVEKEVQSVVVADLDALVEEKVSEAVTEGVSVNQIDYGTF